MHIRMFQIFTIGTIIDPLVSLLHRFTRNIE
jgi:hypothetical protein